MRVFNVPAEAGRAQDFSLEPKPKTKNKAEGRERGGVLGVAAPPHQLGVCGHGRHHHFQSVGYKTMLRAERAGKMLVFNPTCDILGYSIK